MKGESVPDSDHISRFCKPTQAPDGQIQATAFLLRQGEESLSVNWLECLGCIDRDHEISELKKIYTSSFDRIGAQARIVILNVGNVKEKVTTESADKREISILHDPIEEPPIPSHCGIYNLKPDNELIAELIREAILEDYPARL